VTIHQHTIPARDPIRQRNSAPQTPPTLRVPNTRPRSNLGCLVCRAGR
jgi:hypothetical protein